jgi:hypothetical protein
MPKKSRHQQVTELQLIAWYKWEFLRRNPKYRKDYEEFITEFGSWFDEHGYWYDQTTEPWGHDNLRFFASVIAPKARAICEHWEITDPYPPDWQFTREGLYFYKPHFEVLLPTDCLKGSAGKAWDFSGLLLPIEELEKRLPEDTERAHQPRPEYQLPIILDLRRPLKSLVYEATKRIKDRKKRYDRKHPSPKLTQSVRRRLKHYPTYLKIWDLKERDGLKFEAIGALLFPDSPRRAQRALETFERANKLVNGAYKELA